MKHTGLYSPTPTWGTFPGTLRLGTSREGKTSEPLSKVGAAPSGKAWETEV